MDALLNLTTLCLLKSQSSIKATEITFDLSNVTNNAEIFIQQGCNHRGDRCDRGRT